MDFMPLPADAPLAGFFWTWVVPVVLFGIALGATWLLYRHFASRPHDAESGDD